jgi:ribosomal protein S6--L-glutamate ligase
MLEINYFFGRTGLGGSDGYYRLFEAEVDKWLAAAGLNRAA